MIDEDLLKLAAPSLSHLRRLTIWGCTRVTRKTILAILEHAEDIEELSLDALPHTVSSSPGGTNGRICLICPHLQSCRICISTL